MIGREEFEKKQLVLLFANHGERLSFKNDNLVVTEKDGTIKFQTTCYRVFALFVIGSITITSGLIMRAKKFCFSIFLMNNNMRVYDMLGFTAEGNTLLHARQYSISQTDQLVIAKHIIKNKICNQRKALMKQRIRGECFNEVLAQLKGLSERVAETTDLRSLMGLEGTAAKLYFPNQFNNCVWKGRKPRSKCDFINVVLDIGYTLLFNYFDALMRLFGFDVYKGVLHQEFYMRKSLVCDAIEPFRPLMDLCIRKAISLGQCREDDFECCNYGWRLSRDINKEYILFLVKPMIENRVKMFEYARDYYRAFSKPDLKEEMLPLFFI